MTGLVGATADLQEAEAGAEISRGRKHAQLPSLCRPETDERTDADVGLGGFVFNGWRVCVCGTYLQKVTALGVQVRRHAHIIHRHR